MPPLYALNVNVLSSDVYHGDSWYAVVCNSRLDDLQVSVSCYSTTPEIKNWSSSCVIIGIDTSLVTCGAPEVSFLSHGENEVVPLLFKDTKSLLLKNIDLLSSSLEPLDIAQRLYAYYLLNDTTLVTSMLEQLKQFRDNDEKCWPSNSCDLKTTVDILYLLGKANITGSNRIYNDALLWVESEQNYFDDDLNIYFYADEGSNCTMLTGANTSAKSITIDSSEQSNFSYAYVSGTNLTFYCSDDYSVTVLDSYEQELFSDSGSDSSDNSSFIYTTGCWSIKGSQLCSPLITSKVLLLKNLSTTSKTTSKAWLTSQLTPVKTGGKRISSSYDLQTNMYAYAVLNDNDLRTWILYSQNNDGSYGLNESEYPTTLVAIDIFSNDTSEWADDARLWITNHAASDYNLSLFSLSILYYYFPDSIETLKLEPLIPESSDFSIKSLITSNKDASYTNYTFLSTFPTSIPKISLPSLTSKFPLTLNFGYIPDGMSHATLNLKTANRSFAVPFVFNRVPFFKPDLEKIYYTGSSSISLDIPYTVSSSVKNCSIVFPSIFADVSLSFVNDSAPLHEGTLALRGIINDPLFLSNITTAINSQMLIVPVVMSFTCDSTYGLIAGDSAFQLIYLPKDPFTVKILLQKNAKKQKPSVIVISNQLNSPISVRAFLKDPLDMFVVKSNYDIAPLSDISIPLCPLFVADENGTINASLNIEAYNASFSENLQLLTSTRDYSESDCAVAQKRRFQFNDYIIPFSIFGGILFLLILFIVFWYRGYQKREMELAQKRKAAAALAAESKPLKPKKIIQHSKSLAEVLLALDEKLGEPEQQIVSELKKDGFKVREVKDTLAELKQLEESIKKKSDLKEGEKVK